MVLRDFRVWRSGFLSAVCAHCLTRGLSLDISYDMGLCNHPGYLFHGFLYWAGYMRGAPFVRKMPR